jgi:transposase
MPSTFQRHPNPGVVVTVGVDTHADVHVAAVVDQLGRLLGSIAIPTTVEGYAELLAWAEGYGEVGCFGVEGTGSWGASLTRWLAANGQAVVEVPRADRARRRRKGRATPWTPRPLPVPRWRAWIPSRPSARTARWR